jgi:hypothetical protein
MEDPQFEKADLAYLVKECRKLENKLREIIKYEV